MDTGPALRVAHERQGLATWTELRAAASRRCIEAAVASGELRRLARGRFALATSPPALHLAARTGGVVSYLSAAQLWMLPLLRSPSVADITVPASSSAIAPRGARLHWSRLDGRDVRGRVTSPLRTVLDCIRTLPPAEALAVADSALRQRLVEQDELVAAADACRSRGSRQARRVARWADARAANPFESGMRAVVHDLGISGFSPQCRFAVPGTAGYVDVGDPRRRIALEADSFEHHGHRSALHRDCRRYSDLVAGDWLVLRFAWEDVMFDRARVADVIARTVALRAGAQDEVSATGNDRTSR